MKIRITNLDKIYLEDKNYAALTVGSEHDTIPSPEPITKESEGVWVMGANSPTKLFPDEYEVIN